MFSPSFPRRFIPEDGEAHIHTYNLELARLAKISCNTWLTAPWLFAEWAIFCIWTLSNPDGLFSALAYQVLSVRNTNCNNFIVLELIVFSYRLLRSYFSRTDHWRAYDPFFVVKMDTFKRSRKSIFSVYKDLSVAPPLLTCTMKK